MNIIQTFCILCSRNLKDLRQICFPNDNENFVSNFKYDKQRKIVKICLMNILGLDIVDVINYNLQEKINVNLIAYFLSMKK
jgi:hypothetical protein